MQTQRFLAPLFSRDKSISWFWWTGKTQRKCRVCWVYGG